jgi:putative CocE/NonD family hydrolase
VRLAVIAAGATAMLAGILGVAPGVAGAAGSYPGNGSWTPDTPSYGSATTKDQTVTMDDGVRLSADVSYPTDLKSGAVAPGSFPVVLEITPYAKDSPLAGSADPPASFVPYGYVYVLVDIRGTGQSGGSFDLAGPREQRDYQEVIAWAAKLAHSNGKVGMTGASYLALSAELAAGDATPGGPLKAIFPVVGPSDLYRDLILPGGIFNTDFDVPYSLGLEVGLNTVAPVFGPPDAQNFISIEQEHIPGVVGTDLTPVIGGELATTDERYDATYWQQRQPNIQVGRIARNDIPTFVYNVWFDVWQRGDARVYNELQNGLAGRTPDSPMAPGQHADGRFQEAIGPYTHEGSGLLPPTLALEWFDTWLKGVNTGMAQTHTPLHAYEVLGKRWIDTPTWPLAGTTVSTYFLGAGATGTANSLNDGSLSTNRPTTGGNDTLPWVGTDSPCSRSSDQNLILGPVKGVGDLFGAPEDPCFFDDRTLQTNGLTYTTGALAHAVDIGGPIGATIYASANTSETEWIVTVDDVSPDGSSRPLATGDLLGSLRKTDPALGWTLDGKVIAPGHPYDQATRAAVTPGAVTRYDIEIPPILARIDRGHRLRITINSSDTPYLLPFAYELQNLTGGIYNVYRTSQYPSAINVPLVDPRSMTPSTVDWGPCVTDCGNPVPLESGARRLPRRAAPRSRSSAASSHPPHPRRPA